MIVQGQWIAAPLQNTDAVPVFFKSFTSEKRIHRATLTITALGVYEAWLNGKPRRAVCACAGLDVLCAPPAGAAL